MIRKILITTWIILTILIFYLIVNGKTFTTKLDRVEYIVTGTANPGIINIYKNEITGLKFYKSIKSGYKFVHTVRMGDIYNNKKPQIIAGVSNSFFGQPFGCRIISIDFEKLNQNLIDNVGDLRCKDLTIGDADNDGLNEVILGTHGEGIVRIYKWKKNTWEKEDIERNYIAQIDEKNNTNHRVDNKELTCKECIVQTAVHIVKIGDIDNDGKNEVVITMSSPLELIGIDEISYVRIYKREGGKWTGNTIDELINREFRSVTIGDILQNKKNSLLIGIGSPRNEKGSLYLYENKENKWVKKIIHDDMEEKNMKGVAISDIYSDGKNRIILATGFPNAKIMILTWNGVKFDYEDLGKVSSLYNFPTGEFNSMAVKVYQAQYYKKIIVGGMITFPAEKKGWEATEKGFLVDFSRVDNKWTGKAIGNLNTLGLD